LKLTALVTRIVRKASHTSGLNHLPNKTLRTQADSSIAGKSTRLNNWSHAGVIFPLSPDLRFHSPAQTLQVSGQVDSGQGVISRAKSSLLTGETLKKKQYRERPVLSACQMITKLSAVAGYRRGEVHSSALQLLRRLQVQTTYPDNSV